MKDYELDDLKFDAMAWRDRILHLIQFKTNKKPSKKILIQMAELENRRECICLWIDRSTKKRKIIVYSTLCSKGIELKEYSTIIS